VPRKVARLGLILFVFGISLGIVSLLRGSSSYIAMRFFNVPPGDWQTSREVLWPPRDVRLTVEADVEISIYVLDEAGMVSWRGTGDIKPTFSVENARHGIYACDLHKRGVYTIVVHNPSSSKANVRIDVTLYGLEEDIIWASASLALLGVLIVLAQIRSRKKI